MEPMEDYRESPFIMFSTMHWMAIAFLILFSVLLLISKKKWSTQPQFRKLIERSFALSLLVMELLYHGWMILTERWSFQESLPLELCSISLIATIVLLWSGNKLLYGFVFFAGIGGAFQAMLTPVLDLGFPHFRFFHFFYTHIGIILTALYYTWIKGYKPTFKGILITMFVLNVWLPLIFTINILTQGNYMFLREKPLSGSILDFLGPYPWYILSLEIVAFLIFLCLWLIFRKWGSTSKV